MHPEIYKKFKEDQSKRKRKGENNCSNDSRSKIVKICLKILIVNDAYLELIV